MTPEEQNLVNAIGDWRRRLLDERNRALEQLLYGGTPQEPETWFMSTVEDPNSFDVPPQDGSGWRSRPPML